jgi:NADH-quinone oxidoreductase subunit J
MNILFYIASLLAVFATAKVVTAKIVIHALLYFVVSLLSVSVILFLLGAPFIAALEVIIYAGAIMVLFVFVVMMLNLGKASEKAESGLLSIKMWIGPIIVSLILLGEMIYVLLNQRPIMLTGKITDPEVVGHLLFTKYLLVVELSAFLLISGIIGAYHLGEKEKLVHHRFLKKENESV